MDTADILSSTGNHSQALSTYLELWALPYFRADLGLGRRIAYCLEQLGRYREAIHLLGPLVAEAAEPALLDPEERLELGRCRLVLGKSYFEAGQLADAHHEASRAVEDLRDSQGPEAGFAENLLGGISFRRGEVDEAHLHFRAAREHFRSRGDVTNLALSYLNLGTLYKQRCDWSKALEHYQAAYYLRATEGDIKDQGGILQNLSLVLLRVGRYDEAVEKLEESLRRATEQPDPARALRSHLALARVARESLEIEAARAHLTACRAIAPDPFPGREECLLFMERAQLARLDGDSAGAAAAAASLRERVQGVATRGDLMIDTFLLDSWIRLDQESLEEAAAGFRRASDMAVLDHDRELESRALLGQMVVAARRQDFEQGKSLFLRLEERHLRSGEPPALAWLYEIWADLERTIRRDPEEALGWYSRARDLWRKMSRPLLEARLDVELAETLLDLGRAPEAEARLESLRERLAPEVLCRPPLGASVAALEQRIHRVACERRAGELDGERALARLDEALGSAEGAGEKLRTVLMVVAEALKADGALIGRVSGGTCEAACTISMGRLQGRRTFPVSLLGATDPGRAATIRPSTSGNGSLPSALVIPVRFFGRDHVAYLERREAARPAFSHSDLDYALVLLAHAARGLRAGAAEPSIQAELERVGKAIWLADVITQNSRMLSILELIRKVGDSELTVLLQGETGTGKKLLAQAIHRTSRRRDRPFVTVDCAALPDSLLESELFGHRKGAFTGAIQDRVGLLEEANTGTIFLDEIDKAGLSVQRRFLHLLDSGEVRPVGSSGYRRLDVRVVCATSCPDLRQEVKEGRFLKDLYYRLNDISVVVPPLRERPDDIPLLAECFLERFAVETGREIGGVSPSFHAALACHSWPGNVRELEKAIRRVVILADSGSTLLPDLLPAAVRESASAPEAPSGGTLRERLERYERGLVLEVLDRMGWNRSRAAAELGLSRKGLKNKILRYKLDRRRTRRP